MLPGLGLDNTFGALFVGIFGAAFLNGVTTIQMYLYYRQFGFSKDLPRHSVGVALLWFLDGFQLALNLHSVYVHIISGWGSVMIPMFLRIPWSVKAQLIVSVLIVVMVQSLYASRVWCLAGYHRSIYGQLAAFVVALGAVMGSVLVYKVYQLQFYYELLNISWAIYAAFITSTTIDFSIALTMCYFLRKSQGDEFNLNWKISKLMHYTLTTGLFLSTYSLLSLLAFIFRPRTFLVIGVQIPLSGVYVGSFFSMLNSRKCPRESDNATNPKAITFSLQSEP